MIEHELNIGVETSHHLAAEPALASTAVESLIKKWVEAINQQETVAGQQAVTGAVGEEAMPDGATPSAILKGEFGVDTQREFLAGALAAVDHLLAVHLDSRNKSNS